MLTLAAHGEQVVRLGEVIGRSGRQARVKFSGKLGFAASA
jgi:hypothetical protein